MAKAKQAKTPTTPRPAEPRLDQAVLRVLDEARISLPTGEPWTRPTWMEDGIVRPSLMLTPQGTPRFPEVWEESQKGTGKTWATLAVHLAEAITHPGTLVNIAGKDRGAVETDKDFLVGMIDRSPLFKRRCRVLADKIEIQGGSRIVFMFADEPGSHGGGGTHRRWRSVCEDVFAWDSLVLLDSLLAMSGKTPNSRVCILTNPAAKRAGRIWALRTRLKKRHGVDSWFFAPWAEPGKGPVVEWISAAWRLRMQDTLPPGLYARFVEGTWSEDSSFATRAQVEACVGSHGSGRSGRGIVHLGLDIGVKRHHAALAWGQPAEGRFFLHGVRRWDPATLPGHEVPLADVEQEIRHVGSGYGGARMLADPFQGIQMTQALRRDWGEQNVVDFSFGLANQVRLAQAFFEGIVKRLLCLPADVPDVVEEIASLDTVPVGFGFRFEFGGEGTGHGDVAVATALAYLSALLSPYGLQGLRPINIKEAVKLSGQRTSAPASPAARSLIFASTSLPGPWEEAEGTGSIFDRYDAGRLPGQARGRRG